MRTRTKVLLGAALLPWLDAKKTLVACSGKQFGAVDAGELRRRRRETREN